ncbi:hypothetical protein HDU97_008330 [Phlyctochytrium planicorne]|nr:hypothetical protein HDU97_008330 [Phlyctochytrium planicorne]
MPTTTIIFAPFLLAIVLFMNPSSALPQEISSPYSYINSNLAAIPPCARSCLASQGIALPTSVSSVSQRNALCSLTNIVGSIDGNSYVSCLYASGGVCNDVQGVVDRFNALITACGAVPVQVPTVNPSPRPSPSPSPSPSSPSVSPAAASTDVQSRARPSERGDPTTASTSSSLTDSQIALIAGFSAAIVIGLIAAVVIFLVMRDRKRKMERTVQERLAAPSDYLGSDCGLARTDSMGSNVSDASTHGSRTGMRREPHSTVPPTPYVHSSGGGSGSGIGANGPLVQGLGEGPATWANMAQKQAGPSKQFESIRLMGPILSWDAGMVSSALRNCRVEQSVVETLKAHGVNGYGLLELDHATLIAFGLHEVCAREVLLHAIEILRRDCGVDLPPPVYATQ